MQQQMQDMTKQVEDIDKRIVLKKRYVLHQDKGRVKMEGKK